MPRRARLALAVAAVVAVVVGALLLALAKSAPPPPPERPPAQRPELMLLTTLPIVFAERLTLDAPPSPALEALQSRYRVVPISVAAASELASRKLLLMAQPQAQPAEALVELDQWVRGGGRVLLLADPALEWPSERPPGDKLRAPAAFADTGLLGHWGLRLEPPEARGPKQLNIGALRVVTASPGSLAGTCSIERYGLVARCRVGKGQATVVADADFLNVEGPGALDGPTEQNLAALLAELARLEQ